jgi:3-oxoacyl-[acyl-carrier protein] reductase
MTDPKIPCAPVEQRSAERDLFPGTARTDKQSTSCVDSGFFRGAILRTLDGKVALITGSSRGIGAAIAQSFAQQGARVVIHGRDREAMSAVRAIIERAGGTAIAVAAELTRFGEIESMRTETESKLGPVDILVANGGGSFSTPGPLEAMSEEDWRASIDGNLTATFLTIKSILPGMKERRSGNIITISSAAARRPHPQSPVGYACAKAAIELLTQDVAVQAGPHGIRANCIAPEIILTENNSRLIPDAQKAALVETHPVRRLGTPDDVAHAALFLASRESSWITGVVLDVAGGAVMVR